MSSIARGDIIRMAQEAGICDGSFDFQMVSLQDLERFAALVADKTAEDASFKANRSWRLMCEKMVAAEREACARICDTTPPQPFRPSIEAAHAIRARGAK